MLEVEENEIASKIDFKMKSIVKKELAVFENTMISQGNFNAIKEKATVKPIELKSYDPNFWKGHNIVEPNKAIKDFKTIE